MSLGTELILLFWIPNLSFTLVMVARALYFSPR